MPEITTQYVPTWVHNVSVCHFEKRGPKCARSPLSGTHWWVSCSNVNPPHPTPRTTTHTHLSSSSVSIVEGAAVSVSRQGLEPPHAADVRGRVQLVGLSQPQSSLGGVVGVRVRHRRGTPTEVRRNKRRLWMISGATFAQYLYHFVFRRLPSLVCFRLLYIHTRSIYLLRCLPCGFRSRVL